MAGQIVPLQDLNELLNREFQHLILETGPVEVQISYAFGQIERIIVIEL